jgi:hypothetical protein
MSFAVLGSRFSVRVQGSGATTAMRVFDVALIVARMRMGE